MSEEKKKKKNGSAASGRSGTPPAERKKTEKTAAAKSTGGKSAREKAADRSPEPRTGYPDRLPSDGMLHQFMPYILIVAAVFLTACFIFSTIDGAMGVVGKALRDVLCGLLGWPAFFLPLIILNLAVYWRRYVDRGLVGWKLLLSFITIVFISSLVHVFYVSRALPAYGWSEYWNSVTGSGSLQSNWALGVAIKGGGFLGGFAGGFFNRTVGFVGSTILLIALIIVSVMFLFSVTPGYVLTSIKYRIKKHREKREKRREEEEERTRRAEEAERIARERREREREQAEEAADTKKKKKEREFYADAVVTDSPDGKIADSPKVLGTVENFIPDKKTGTRAGPAAVMLNSSPGTENSLSAVTGQTKTAQPAEPEPAASAARSTAGTAGSGKRDPALQSTYEVLDRIFGDHPKGNKTKPASAGAADTAASGTTAAPSVTLQPGAASASGKSVPASGTRTPVTAAGESRSIPVVKAEMAPTHVTDPDPEEDSAVTDGVVAGRGSRSGQMATYFFPPIDLLAKPDASENEDYTEELREKAERIMQKLAAFNVKIRKIEYSRGPTITRFELYPEANTRVRSISSLADDIALELADMIRIEAPIPHKNAVGIEVPNANRKKVYLREMLESEKFKSLPGLLTFCLGKDIGGNMVFGDISKMPHLLIAGTTGSGKSVCMNSIILSLLYRVRPSEVQFIMIDPKKVEMNMYNGLPYLKTPVVTDVKRAAGTLNAAVSDMENRYSLFEDVHARNLDGYNKLMAQDDPGFVPLPRIVIFIDELADLIMTGPQEIEDSIVRLAQKARAAGIHLIIGTQRPTANVITGLIKGNIPTRIAFAVKSNTDSRVILDMGGAEKLIGYGDMLFSPIGIGKPSRIQGAFVDDVEVRAVTKYIKEHSEAVQYDDEFISMVDRETDRLTAEDKHSSSADEDPTEFVQEADSMFNKALHIAVDNGTVATSLLQRKLSIGFGRASKIIDRMEALSFVSGANGTKARQVLLSRQELLELEMANDPRVQGKFV